MFRAWCEAERAEVLLTTRRITAVDRGAGQVSITFTCWCGHVGRTVDSTAPVPTDARPPAPPASVRPALAPA